MSIATPGLSRNSTLWDENADEPIKPAGRVVGGRHITDFEEKFGTLNKEATQWTTVDADMPLTLWVPAELKGKPVRLLKFTPGDPENPFNWSSTRKSFTANVLCLMTLFIGLATTAYSSGIGSMVEELHSTQEVGQVGLFTFNFVCALAPLFLAPFCELSGRRYIYVGAYFGFSVLFIGLALAKNIATVLILRGFLGLFGCVGTILVGGTFSDMYPSRERARPMARFTFVAIFGTVFAPVYAGFIDETIGWRWIQGIQGLSNIPLLLVVIFFFRETRGGVVLQKRAKVLRQLTGEDDWLSEIDLEAGNLGEMLQNSSVKAIKMLATEPVVFAWGLFIGFSWFVVFLYLSVIPITFEEMRGWSHGIGGLPYISLAIGTVIGYAANTFQMRKYEQIESGGERRPLPEDRLYGAMYGAIWLPIGLFIYSFTQYGYLPWIAPTIALAPIAVGIFFIFEATYSVTSDYYGGNASSAIAGQGLMRNTLGAVSPLFASQFFHNVGSQYAGLILALIAVVLSMIPFVMFKYGHKLREKSKLAKKF